MKSATARREPPPAADSAELMFLPDRVCAELAGVDVRLVRAMSVDPRVRAYLRGGSAFICLQDVEALLAEEAAGSPGVTPECACPSGVSVVKGKPRVLIARGACDLGSDPCGGRPGYGPPLGFKAKANAREES